MRTALRYNHRNLGQSLGLFLCLTVFAFGSLCSSNAQAQTVHDFGSWFSVNTQGKMNRCDPESRLKWWFDGHLRYFDDADGFGQSIFRPGIGYQLTENTNVWVGYAWINNNPGGGAAFFDENRLWQQLIWSKKVGPHSLMSRSRLEQRFDERGSDTGWRFRQMLRTSRPFYEGSPFTFVLWDEAFMGLNDTDWGQRGSFGQNRAFVGIGRKLNGPNSPRIEVGYMNQFIRRKGGDDTFNHILSANWFWTF